MKGNTFVCLETYVKGNKALSSDQESLYVFNLFREIAKSDY
jgi:hypothetical protein